MLEAEGRAEGREPFVCQLHWGQSGALTFSAFCHCAPNHAAPSFMCLALFKFHAFNKRPPPEENLDLTELNSNQHRAHFYLISWGEGGLLQNLI